MGKVSFSLPTGRCGFLARRWAALQAPVAALTPLSMIRRDLRTWKTLEPRTSSGSSTATSRRSWSWGLQPSGRAQGLCWSFSSSISASGLSSPSGTSSSCLAGSAHSPGWPPWGLLRAAKRDLFCREGERRGSDSPADHRPQSTSMAVPPWTLPSCQGHRGSPAESGVSGAPEEQPRYCEDQVLPSSLSPAQNSLAQWQESLSLGDGRDAGALGTKLCKWSQPGTVPSSPRLGINPWFPGYPTGFWGFLPALGRNCRVQHEPCPLAKDLWYGVCHLT